MIWYQKDFIVEESDVVLRGVYNPPEDLPVNVIEIQLDIGGNSRVVYSHNPSMMTHEEPSPEDVYRKYSHKIAKWVKRINDGTLEELQ